PTGRTVPGTAHRCTALRYAEHGHERRCTRGRGSRQHHGAHRHGHLRGAVGLASPAAIGLPVGNPPRSLRLSSGYHPCPMRPLALALALTALAPAWAQRNLEVGMASGTVLYFGDLGNYQGAVQWN